LLSNYLEYWGANLKKEEHNRGYDKAGERSIWFEAIALL